MTQMTRIFQSVTANSIVVQSVKILYVDAQIWCIIDNLLYFTIFLNIHL